VVIIAEEDLPATPAGSSLSKEVQEGQDQSVVHIVLRLKPNPRRSKT
jgi:hypothetical protein